MKGLDKMEENKSIFPDLKNEELVKAMEALKQNENPQTQGAFVAAAVKANYFAPVDVLDADGNPIEGDGKMQVPKDAKFSFKLLKNTEGQGFFPMFTDINEFQKWNKDEKIKTIVVNFPQMASLAMKKSDEAAGIAINPLSHNLVFTLDLIKNLLAHLQKQQAERAADGQEKKGEVKFLFGTPKNIPDSVLDSFRKTLARIPEINAVYFVMMKQDGLDQENYMFIFDTALSPEEERKAAEKFCASARLVLTKFPVLPASLHSPVGEHAPKITEPFYKKEQ